MLTFNDIESMLEEEYEKLEADFIKREVAMLTYQQQEARSNL